MTAQRGYECKLYRNTGTYDTPVWSEIKYVRDNQLNQEAGEVDVTSRASGGHKEVIAGLFEEGLEFDIRWKPDDANFAALRTAFHARGTVELAAMDGDVAAAGSQGLRGTFAVLSFSRPEKLEEGTVANVVVKPTSSDHVPEWMTVA